MDFIEDERTDVYSLPDASLKRLEDICSAIEQGGDVALFGFLEALRAFGDLPDAQRAAKDFLRDRLYSGFRRRKTACTISR